MKGTVIGGSSIGRGGDGQERASEVVLIRHAETEWTVSRRHTGRTDVPLTEAGRAGALRLGPRLTARRFALVLTSPLSRAAQTAALAGLDADVDPDLAEWDYGRYEGMTTAQIRQVRPGWWLWRDGCPGGEDSAAVGARADRVVERVLNLGEGDAALVAHGHLLRALAARWCELEPAAGGRLELDPGSVSVLGWERDIRVIRHWNGR